MAWELTGNSGTRPPTEFLGTKDKQPLVIKVRDKEAIRITYDDDRNLSIKIAEQGKEGSLFGLDRLVGLNDLRFYVDDVGNYEKMCLDDKELRMARECNLRIHDADIWLRGGKDENHGIGWYGPGKIWFDPGEIIGPIAPDGPVIFGHSGGVLATTAGGKQRCLEWKDNGKVYVTSLDASHLEVRDIISTKPLKPDAGLPHGVTPEDCKILLYNYHENNWAGLGVHTGGDIWIRTGTGGPHVFRFTEGGHFTMPKGAYCDGLKWNNASSLEYKTDVSPLSLDKALKTLAALNPVTFRYKEGYGNKEVGFIAEEAPQLIGNPDKKSLNVMGIVGILTSVLQHQQEEIAALKARLKK